MSAALALFMSFRAVALHKMLRLISVTGMFFVNVVHVVEFKKKRKSGTLNHGAAFKTRHGFCISDCCHHCFFSCISIIIPEGRSFVHFCGFGGCSFLLSRLHGFDANQAKVCGCAALGLAAGTERRTPVGPVLSGQRPL